MNLRREQTKKTYLEIVDSYELPILMPDEEITFTRSFANLDIKNFKLTAWKDTEYFHSESGIVNINGLKGHKIATFKGYNNRTLFVVIIGELGIITTDRGIKEYDS